MSTFLCAYSEEDPVGYTDLFNSHRMLTADLLAGTVVGTAEM